MDFLCCDIASRCNCKLCSTVTELGISKELVLRARKSNAAYKEDLRRAEEEEKARLATREREKEEAARKKRTRPTLRRRYKIFREKSRLRRRRPLWQKAKR